MTDSGDLTYFFHYHLGVISRAIRELHEYLENENRKSREADRTLRKYEQLNHRQFEAIKQPASQFTVQLHSGRFNVVLATARKDLLDLVEMGFLTKRKRSRQWIFEPIEGLEIKLETD